MRAKRAWKSIRPLPGTRLEGYREAVQGVSILMDTQRCQKSQARENFGTIVGNLTLSRVETFLRRVWRLVWLTWGVNRVHSQLKALPCFTLMNWSVKDVGLNRFAVVFKAIRCSRRAQLWNRQASIIMDLTTLALRHGWHSLPRV